MAPCRAGGRCRAIVVRSARRKVPRSSSNWFRGVWRKISVTGDLVHDRRFSPGGSIAATPLISVPRPWVVMPFGWPSTYRQPGHAGVRAEVRDRHVKQYIDSWKAIRRNHSRGVTCACPQLWSGKNLCRRVGIWPLRRFKQSVRSGTRAGARSVRYGQDQGKVCLIRLPEVSSSDKSLTKVGRFWIATMPVQSRNQENFRSQEMSHGRSI